MQNRNRWWCHYVGVVTNPSVTRISHRVFSHHLLRVVTNSIAFLCWQFYIQDTKSSNGTFINNQRLCKSGEESPVREVFSGDLIQFGVEVMENNRRGEKSELHFISNRNISVCRDLAVRITRVLKVGPEFCWEHKKCVFFYWVHVLPDGIVLIRWHPFVVLLTYCHVWCFFFSLKTVKKCSISSHKNHKSGLIFLSFTPCTPTWVLAFDCQCSPWTHTGVPSLDCQCSPQDTHRSA